MRTPKNETTEDPVVLRIMDLLNDQNKTQKELVEYLGLGNGAFTRWRYQGGKSYRTYINEIAEFLGTTPTYLLNGKVENISIENLSDKEIELIEEYRKLDPKGKELIKSSIRILNS